MFKKRLRKPKIVKFAVFRSLVNEYLIESDHITSNRKLFNEKNEKKTIEQAEQTTNGRPTKLHLAKS